MMATIPAQSKIETLSQALEKCRGTFSKVAASVVTPDKLIKIAIAAAQRTPLLLECTPQSIIRSVMQGAELGLTPGSALNQAYLVPFKNKNGTYEAQLIISAQGLAELAYRTGMVSFLSVEVVYEGDTFEYELGLNPVLRHVPGDESDSSKITHAYVVVGMKDGAKIFRVMTRKQIDRVRAISKASNNSPWVDHYAEMARKTVAKNGLKYVPKSIEVARAVALDNAVESGDWSGIEFDSPEALAIEPTEEPSAVKKLAAKVAQIPKAEPALDLEEIQKKEALEQLCIQYGVTYAGAVARAEELGEVLTEELIEREFEK